VALSTDDEGVSRIDLTHEYVRAALDYHLNYRDLKELARTGMEHDFCRDKPVGCGGCFHGTGGSMQRTGAGDGEAFIRMQGASGRERKGFGAVGAGAAVPGV